MITKAKKNAAPRKTKLSPFATWWEKYRHRFGFWSEYEAELSARAAWNEATKRTKP